MKELPSLFRFQWLKLTLLFSLLPFFGYSQINITVLDETDKPLIGVHVNFNGKDHVTDIQGVFQISDDLSQDTEFQFQFLGYKDLTIFLESILDNDSVVHLEPDKNLLEEIIIVGRTNLRNTDLPFNIKHISADDIYSSSAQNSADLLELDGGAYVQKSQMGGGSPVVRGFEANKLLLVIDGVRMNNAIYRNGHLQNAITIDPSTLKQVEIIYGPGSLMYGTEALGGVIHFRTKSPRILYSDKTNHNISAYSRYSSANNENTFHINHSLSTNRFGVLTSVTYSDFSDLRSGRKHPSAYPDFGLRPDYVSSNGGVDSIVLNEDPHIQIGTAYTQVDIMQKWLFGLSDNLKLNLNFQHSSSSDIPRYDNLIERRNGSLRFSEWYYGPQKRSLISPKLTWNNRGAFFDKAILILSYQKINEDRISRLLNNPFRDKQNERVDVWGSTLDFEKRISTTQKVTYGLDFHHNSVNSKAESENILTSETSPILTRYPNGNSTMFNTGIYINHTLQNKDSTLVWNNGVRWSHQEVRMNYLRDELFQWPEYFYSGIKNSNDAIVGISGINLNIKPWLIKVSSGTAFRSPNVDDLAKIRVNNDEITVPNPDLNSEKIWNSEITLAYRSRNFNIAMTGFYTKLTDAIIRSDFTLPDGNSKYIISQDTFNVTANINATKGIIKGVSANLKWRINSSFQFYSSISILSGKSENTGEIQKPLGHIPPIYGSTYLKFNAKDYHLKLSMNYNGWKRIEDFGGSVDNPELATPEGSPSWLVWNFDTHYNINRFWMINFGINNILDRHYRPFSSGLSAPGRHFIVSLKYTLKE